MDDLREQLATPQTDPERFRLLCNLVSEHIAVDIQKATLHAEECLELARAEVSPEMEGEALDLLGECYARSGRFREGISTMVEAIPLLERTGDHRRAMVVNTNIGNTHWMAGEYEEAFDRFQESHKRAIVLDDQHHIHLVKNNLGNLLLHWRRYSEAREYIEESLAFSREAKDEKGMAYALHNLGRICVELLEYPEGLRNLRESLELFTRLDDKSGIAAVQIELGLLYRVLGDYAESIKAYGESVTITRSIGDRRNEGMGLNNIGDLYQHTGQYERALEYFRLSLGIKEELGNPREIATTLLNIGAVTLTQGRGDEAITIFERVRSIAGGIDDARLQTHALVNLAGIFCSGGELSRSTEMLREAEPFLQTMEGTTEWGQLQAEVGRVQTNTGQVERGVETLREVLSYAEETGRSDLQARAHELLSEAFQVAGEVNAALLHLRKHRDLEREIFRRDSDHRLKSLMVIYEVDRARAEEQLVRKEAEFLRLTNKQLEQEIEHRQKELHSTAMFLSQKNDLLRKVFQRVKDLSLASSTNLGKELRTLSGEIQGIINSEETWSTFEEQFRQVHGDYLQMLASQFPKLTPTELKVCGLIRTGLSTKEIAQILTAEPRSIDKYRQRIRKKIGIDSSVNLQTFLQGIGS